ncbi:hypothetical protein GQ457_01G000810 [Hibiscus cannabinus]
MKSPKSNGYVSPPEIRSPFSKFINDLSPIKTSRARPSLCTQRLTESCFPIIPPVFNSPQSDTNQPTNFLQRDGINWSSSNDCDHSEVVGQYQGVLEDETIVQNQANDGGVQTSLVEISNDESLDRMLEFSSEFLEHQTMLTQVLQSNNDHVTQNMETQQDVSCFNQLSTPCQQVVESKYSSERKRKNETYTYKIDSCKLCNCKRSNCLKLYCECFAAGIYCEDCCACENCLNKPDYDELVHDSRKKIETRNPIAFAPPIVKPSSDSLTIGGDGNTSNLSARHKRGCKCKRSKCLKKYCECYRAKVGCSDGCHCENCDNSFGKKSEQRFKRVEKWMNQYHEMPNTAEVMSDSINVVTSNQLSPILEELADVNHLNVSTHGQSRAVPSLTSHDMRGIQNNPQAEPKQGTNLHWWYSALNSKQPWPSNVSDESHSFDNIYELMEDGFPDMLMGNSNPSNTVKSSSPNQKRISPPKFPSIEFGSNFLPGLPTARKLVLPTNQAENDHQGSKNDQ